ncbi:ribokinase [Robbsia sp. KACC 23696]|uniref:ribokinase n=1 Tax=Robbsia sp. KACC 23696 TaxID=3149231 RepID=UPI00325BF689
MSPVTPSARKSPSIVVVGSANMDLVVRAPRLPVPGETLAGTGFETIPGGKGANQAVAAARLGATVTMVGCVGDDAFGTTLRDGLKADGIETGTLRTVPGSSGIAVISVAQDGANSIVIVGGANDALTRDDVDAASAAIGAADMVICQLETPLATVEYAIATAVRQNTAVLLNPAPARPLPDALLAQVDYLVVNETEAELMSGIPVRDAEDAERAAAALLAQGAAYVIVTLGANGVFWQASSTKAADSNGGPSKGHVPAHKVTAVDTTAAGDTFAGGFAAARAAGQAMADAIAFGQRAAALSVTRHGAQTSIPTRAEVLADAAT